MKLQKKSILHALFKTLLIAIFSFSITVSAHTKVAKTVPEPVYGWILLNNNEQEVMKTIDRANELGVNHIQLSQDIIMNIDDITGNDQASQARVNLINKAIERAHSYNMKVYIWCHEFSNLKSKIVNYTNPNAKVWKDRIDAYRTGLNKIPKLDGIILMFGSAPESPWETISIIPECLRITYIIERIGGYIVNDYSKEDPKHTPKELFIRTFVHQPLEVFWHEMGLSAADGVKFTGMHKGPVQDWQPYNPQNPCIGNIGNHPCVEELDACGEYYGRSVLPFCAPGYYRYRLNNIWKNKGIGSVVRVQRAGLSAIDTPNMVNIYAIKGLVNNHNASLETIWNNFIEIFYGIEAGNEDQNILKQFLKNTFPIRRKSHYVLGIWAFCKSSEFPESTKLTKGQFYSRGLMPQWNIAWTPVWTSLLTPSKHTVIRIWQEGTEAVEIADNDYNKFMAMNLTLSPEKYAETKKWLLHQKLAAHAWRDIDLITFGAKAEITHPFDKELKAWINWALDDLKKIKNQMIKGGLSDEKVEPPSELETFLSNSLKHYNKKIKPEKPDVFSISRAKEVLKKGGMLSIKGNSANIGIGIGKACLFDNNVSFEKVAHTETDDEIKEIKYLEKAIETTKKKTLTLEQKALSLISEADASIFCAHLLFLEDKVLIEKIKNDIRKNHHTAEFSIKVIFEEYSERFMSMQASIFKEKIMDLKDVMLRLLDVVKNIKYGAPENEDKIKLCNNNAILVVKEILPSALIRLPVDNLCGIVCEKGGGADHVAILAKALNIPAIRGIKDITEVVNANEDIIIDGQTELVHIRPDDETKENFIRLLKSQNESENICEADTDTVTIDSYKFFLKANIALISETSLLKRYGAEGIGLYRTEFLYMIRDHEPTEDEQFNIFKRVIDNAHGLEVTIRVLDIGGDKPLPYVNTSKEDNPALGNRGIRLLLSNISLFKTHLRAILRAGAFGKIKLLFPMVSNSSEVDKILEIISEVETELQVKGVEFADDYDIGVMLEVPSLLFDIDSVLEKIDFLSLGTNDLVQYIFASDRTNELTYRKNLYLSPIFLNILKSIGDAVKRHEDKSVSVCGEMAGDIFAIPLLMATGINEFSMAPRFIPKVRKIIKELSYSDCCELFEKALKKNNPDDVYDLVETFYKEKLVEPFLLAQKKS